MPSPENPRLLLAGEHVHPQYWSFMHGARLSGRNYKNLIWVLDSWRAMTLKEEKFCPETSKRIFRNRPDNQKFKGIKQ